MPDTVSEQASDYKSHVLYVVPEEANSQKALRLLRQHRAVEDDVWVQDVRMLQAPLPAWLTGVPTIISRKEGAPHRGTACLGYLQELQRGTPDGVAALPAGGAGGGGGGFHDFGTGLPVGSTHQEVDMKYSANRWMQDGKIDEKTVDQYMAEREQQSTQFATQETHAQDLISTQS